jgi:hypothetical protein
MSDVAMTFGEPAEHNQVYARDEASNAALAGKFCRRGAEQFAPRS